MCRKPLGLAVLALAAGCGGPYRTADVSGVVTLNGAPLPNAVVNFQPAAGEAKNPGPGSFGVTDADGRFELTLKSDGTTRGAVVGPHRVSISVKQDPGPADDDRSRRVRQAVPARYNAKTTLDFTVEPGGTKAADFTLTSP